MTVASGLVRSFAQLAVVRVLAAVVALTVRELPRGCAEVRKLETHPALFGEVLRFLIRRRTLMLIVLGTAMQPLSVLRHHHVGADVPRARTRHVLERSRHEPRLDRRDRRYFGRPGRRPLGRLSGSARRALVHVAAGAAVAARDPFRTRFCATAATRTIACMLHSVLRRWSWACPVDLRACCSGPHRVGWSTIWRPSPVPELEAVRQRFKRARVRAQFRAVMVVRPSSDRPAPDTPLAAHGN